MPSRRREAVLPLAALLAALSARPGLAASEPNDPWESANREFFAINRGLDQAIIWPLARGYRAVVPSSVRQSIARLTQNLGEPVVMANDLLQGHPGRGASTLGRFAINSIFGIGGLFDVAARGGIPHRNNDFGLTLGRWGVKPGPYVFVPLLGPSTVRDLFGNGVDIGLDPLTYVDYRNRAVVTAALVVTSGLEKRIEAARDLDTIEQTSTDPYATLRSYYLQNRAADVHEGKPQLQDLPDFDELAPPGAPAPAPAEKTPAEPVPDAAPAPSPPSSAPSAPDSAAPPAPPAPPAPAAPADPDTRPPELV
jgi:phospholipid-binding lipoprotein MlaA